MKRHKGLGLSWACSHGQYALDEHGRDILPHLIGGRSCQPTTFKPGDVGGGGVQIFGVFLAGFLHRKILPFDKEFMNRPYRSSYLPNPVG